jgi:hypothetical protein
MIMKVRNNKTGKELTITPEGWDKLKALGYAGRYSVITTKEAFQPKELKTVKADKENKI